MNDDQWGSGDWYYTTPSDNAGNRNKEGFISAYAIYLLRNINLNINAFYVDTIPEKKTANPEHSNSEMYSQGL